VVRAARAAGNTAGKKMGCRAQLTWFRQVRMKSRTGFGVGMKAAQWSNALFAGRGPSACSKKVHEIAGSAAIIRILELSSRSEADPSLWGNPHQAKRFTRSCSKPKSTRQRSIPKAIISGLTGDTSVARTWR